MVSQAEYASLMDALTAYRQSDPLLFLKGVALSESLAEPKLRHLRAEALHALAMKLHEALRICDLRHEIVIRPEGVFVQLGGVLLEPAQRRRNRAARAPRLRARPEAVTNLWFVGR